MKYKDLKNYVIIQLGNFQYLKDLELPGSQIMITKL